MQQFFTILGGMGTLATESYVRLLDKRTPIHRDQDYLNYLVVNHATVPDRTTWILDHSQPDPNEALIEDIKQQSLLNPAFFVLICNTAHYSIPLIILDERLCKTALINRIRNAAASITSAIDVALA